MVGNQSGRRRKVCPTRGKKAVDGRRVVGAGIGVLLIERHLAVEVFPQDLRTGNRGRRPVRVMFQAGRRIDGDQRGGAGGSLQRLRIVVIDKPVDHGIARGIEVIGLPRQEIIVDNGGNIIGIGLDTGSETLRHDIISHPGGMTVLNTENAVDGSLLMLIQRVVIRALAFVRH